MDKQIVNSLQKVELRLIGSSFKNNQQYVAQLPSDYIDFISMYNGGVGFVGDNNYIDLWTVERISELNPYFPDEEFSRQVIVIGSNGSGILYGYDLLEKCFFETDEYQMNRAEVIKCGADFFSLINYLETKKA